MTAPSSRRQLGRAPRAFRRVVVRCPFGRPAVTEQEAYDVDGRPFPTTYYLTCRHLVAAVSRLEAGGGVERWSEVVASDPGLRASLDRATEEQRAVRRELAAGRTGSDGGASLELGIGGSRQPAAAQVPPRARRLRARAARLRARRADPRRARGAVAGAMLQRPGRRLPSRPLVSAAAVETTRREWEESSAPARGRGRRPRPVPPPPRAGRPRRRRAPQARRARPSRSPSSRDAYADADRWARASLAEAGAPRGWPTTLALVVGAAFHQYARGASDYRP